MMEALRLRARDRKAVGFGEFMEVALYDPAVGYYRRDAQRIGYGPGTDFLTASVSAPLFGRLVVAACVHLLGSADPGLYEFVEIGAERDSGILSDLPHPFGSTRLVGIGDDLTLAGPSIVFSNELFDAQPFRRFRFGAGGWRELGVSVGAEHLTEIEMDVALPGFERLPSIAPGGYVIDAPLAAEALAQKIAAQPWEGLFLAFDYGKAWEEIAFGTPEGTARAYRRHVQGNDLLAFPGSQDLTCHVCWDWIADALRMSGFEEPRLESQEAFFIRNAGKFLETIATSEATRLSRDKLSLMQLLHPAHMGQKFQALWSLRTGESRRR
jgi:SAM-dependent MidA family methyltransferase